MVGADFPPMDVREGVAGQRVGDACLDEIGGTRWSLTMARAFNDTMAFIEPIMSSCGALAPATSSSNKGADLNYGPRGPQRRKNLQLRPATYG